MNRYARLRFERGLTQREVANRTGVSRATLIRLEIDDTISVRASTAKALADFYGMSIAALLGLEPHEPNGDTTHVGDAA